MPGVIIEESPQGPDGSIKLTRYLVDCQTNTTINKLYQNIVRTMTIKIEDDGRGYPEAMLTKSHEELCDFELSQGRTGLGLFFAKLIANAHSQGDKVGSIALSNGGSLGGSVFEVKIP